MVAHSRDTRDARAARRLNEPRPAGVVCTDDVPVAVDRVEVARVREEWRVVDRWWTELPVRRRYFDVVLVTGENLSVFRDELADSWFRQRA